MLTRPASLLRLEGALLLGMSVFVYARLGESWLLFALLLLVPDLSALGYLINPTVGAGVYNLAHSELFPAVLIVAGLVLSQSLLVALGLIWLVHLGLDRMLGFGLKYPTKISRYASATRVTDAKSLAPPESSGFLPVRYYREYEGDIPCASLRLANTAIN